MNKVYKCESCGNEVSDSQKFCNHCGAEFINDACKSKPKKRKLSDDALLGSDDSDYEAIYDPTTAYESLVEEVS